MTDMMSSKRRSKATARIRNRDTPPELAVRRITHCAGKNCLRTCTIEARFAIRRAL